MQHFATFFTGTNGRRTLAYELRVEAVQ